MPTDAQIANDGAMTPSCAAQRAMKQHESDLMLDCANDPDLSVWHMIASLIEFCDEHGVDFDERLSCVREFFTTERGTGT